MVGTSSRAIFVVFLFANTGLSIRSEVNADGLISEVDDSFDEAPRVSGIPYHVDEAHEARNTQKKNNAVLKQLEELKPGSGRGAIEGYLNALNKGTSDADVAEAVRVFGRGDPASTADALKAELEKIHPIGNVSMTPKNNEAIVYYGFGRKKKVQLPAKAKDVRKILEEKLSEDYVTIEYFYWKDGRDKPIQYELSTAEVNSKQKAGYPLIAHLGD